MITEENANICIQDLIDTLNKIIVTNRQLKKQNDELRALVDLAQNDIDRLAHCAENPDLLPKILPKLPGSPSRRPHRKRIHQNNKEA